MLGGTGKHGCVEDAKIDEFVAAMYHTILVSPYLLDRSKVSDELNREES